MGFFSKTRDKSVVYSEEAEKALNQSPNGSRLNWGLIILIVGAVWAVIALVKSILYFF